MKVRLIVLFAVLLAGLTLPPAQAASPNQAEQKIAQRIWALEEAYIAHNAAGENQAVMELIHDRFLGWPDRRPQPIDKKTLTDYNLSRPAMPASLKCTIEPAGIQVMGEVVINHYHLKCSWASGGAARESTSRIIHTWVKEGADWKILGGMSDRN